MKKTFLLLLIACFALSCEGPMGPQGPPGPRGSGIEWFADGFTVEEKDWKRGIEDGNKNPYYFFDFTVEELTKDIYYDAVIVAYLEVDNRRSPLPNIRLNEDTVDGRKVYWTRAIDFDYSGENITFYVTESDFKDVRPETMTFRLKFVW